jgi:pyruvate/2-oxoglutarate dehydrogenase complex dihydrolipoamide acyltransferase (E2) component
MTRVKIVLPKSGMGIEEGTVVRWLKGIGDDVREGELLVEIETAKALQEVEAPASGTLVEIAAAVGVTVPVHAPLGSIDVHHG